MSKGVLSKRSSETVRNHRNAVRNAPERLSAMGRNLHVELAVDKIDSFAHPDTRQEAKERFDQAQRLWVQTREADCQAESAFVWLRSARTRQGYTAACMRDLTAGRVVELKKRYLLPD
jgi:Lysozyme inhibitor LprI